MHSVQTLTWNFRELFEKTEAYTVKLPNIFNEDIEGIFSIEFFSGMTVQFSRQKLNFCSNFSL